IRCGPCVPSGGCSLQCVEYDYPGNWITIRHLAGEWEVRHARLAMRASPTPLPWPETSPISATSMPPGVLRIPMRERVDFALHVTLRYARQIATYWPVATAKALRSRYPEFVSDDEFCSLLYDTSMAKLLCST